MAAVWTVARVNRSLVERTADRQAAAIQNVGIDHGGLDILVAEEFLNGSDIVPGFEQVRGKAMPECVTTRGLGEAGQTHRVPSFHSGQALTARWRLLSSTWWRRLTPVRGSIERRSDGKTYCQPHSLFALGYLRSSA